MSINPSTVGNDVYDMLDGSVSAFYADVDEAIVASEVVKGQYRLTVNPAYNSPNPVAINNFTTVGLSQSGPMVVDLDNSYITAQATIKFKLQLPIEAVAANAGKYYAFFLGWKSSIEAINRYDILVNSTPIYNQSFCGEESFLQYQVLNENVKHTSPYIYTSFQEAKNMSPNVCGTYVILDASKAYGTDYTFMANIPIKIPITNFILLKNIKYLLSWMGKWELRLYFNYDNMIVLPIDKDIVAKSLSCGAATLPTATKDQFAQISDVFNFPGKNDIAGNANLQKIMVQEMVFNNVEMVSAQFQLRMDICEMIKQKYLGGKPLTFPVSSFQIAKFTNPTNAGLNIAQDSFIELNAVLCQAINNCDTMFILPYLRGDRHTICENPHVANFQLHAGEYGTYPTQPFDTFENGEYCDTRLIRYLNIIADSLNVNSSDLTSFNEDTWGAHRYQLPVSMNHGTKTRRDIDNAYIGPNGEKFDQTNFFIGIPFSTDDDFQGGLSSPTSNINFKITGQVYNIDSPNGLQYTTPWTAAFLIDGVVMVRPDPVSDAAKVIWSDRTVV